jgi:5-methylcytosine-specific restriction protein A
LKIADLGAPILAAKSDWLVATDWIGFTPSSDTGAARERCRSTIARQCRGGYVIEYITQSYDKPNDGFRTDEQYVSERAAHRHVAGRFVAVHRLQPAATPLRDILGPDAYDRLQNMWAVGGKRYRWSVAFPIVESYTVEGTPLASQVLDRDAMQRLFAHPSATLRPLNDRERVMLGELRLIKRATRHEMLTIEDDFRKAELSDIPAAITNRIEQDLAGALEGITAEVASRRRRRVAWLAQRYVLRRQAYGHLSCDDCGLDPAIITAGTPIRPRSLLDVHHKYPLCEGERYTTIEDFELLCPTCHRFEHGRLRAGISRHQIDPASIAT